MLKYFHSLFFSIFPQSVKMSVEIFLLLLWGSSYVESTAKILSLINLGINPLRNEDSSAHFLAVKHQ